MCKNETKHEHRTFIRFFPQLFVELEISAHTHII